MNKNVLTTPQEGESHTKALGGSKTKKKPLEALFKDRLLASVQSRLEAACTDMDKNVFTTTSRRLKTKKIKFIPQVLLLARLKPPLSSPFKPL